MDLTVLYNLISEVTFLTSSILHYVQPTLKGRRLLKDLSTRSKGSLGAVKSAVTGNEMTYIWPLAYIGSIYTYLTFLWYESNTQ